MGQLKSTAVQPHLNAAAAHDVRHVLRAALGVAVQVEPFESKGLKSVSHVIGSRVEIRRVSAVGQGESTRSAPPGTPSSAP
jgi:hypothetical protein